MPPVPPLSLALARDWACAAAHSLRSNRAPAVPLYLRLCSLFRNSVGATGAAELAAALKSNDSMTTLLLNDNAVGDAGAVALATALTENSAMTTLE